MAGKIPRAWYSCCAHGCRNNTKNESEMSFFKFPSSEERRKVWLKLLSREDLLERSANSTFLSWRVCEAHFAPDLVLESSKRKLLKKNAVPSINLPGNYFNLATTETSDVASQCNILSKTDLIRRNPLSSAISLKGKNNNEKKICSKRIKLTNNNVKVATNIFANLCDGILSNFLANVVKKQVALGYQSPGSGDSLDFQIFCMNLYYTSPQAYNMLKNTLGLPSKTKLKRMYNNYMPMFTNIDSHFMDILKTRVEQMNDMDRNCTLVIGKIRLKPNLFYNIKEDRIYGFQDIDGIQSQVLAKYALVAMIHGISKNFQQPVGYALLAEWNNFQSVSEWIDKLIQKLFAIDLNVRVLVTDMDSVFLNGASNRSVSTERPYFFVNCRKIYYIFDAPSLIKSVRNSLMQYDFHFEGNVATWDDIKNFFDKDKVKPLRLARHLTERHIKVENADRQEVKYAVQVFSATVASALSAYQYFGAIKKSSEGTIKLITIMNNLFDFLNSSSRYGSTKYQNSLCGDKFQFFFIHDMIEFFKSLTLIEYGQDATFKVKFINGYQITLKSILFLFEDLKREGFSNIPTKRLNQDCLNNFSGLVSTRNGKPNSPRTWQLISTYRKLFFNSIFKSPKGLNTSNNLVKLLMQGEHFYSPPVGQRSHHTNNKSKVTKIARSDYNTLELPDKNPLIYISGYLLEKCLAQHDDCDVFNSYIKLDVASSSNVTSDNKTYTHYTNYCYEGGKLLVIIPPDSFVEFIESMEKQFHEFMELKNKNCHLLKELLVTVENLHAPISCNCFPELYCKTLYFRIRLYNTLKSYNHEIQSCANFCVTKL